MKSNWLEVVLDHPWRVLFTCLILVVAAAFGGKNLYFRGDYKVFFAPDNPQRLAFDEMQGIFNKIENVSIIVAPKSGNVFSTKTLTLVKELTDEAWQTPFSNRVDSITNYQHTWSEYDDMIVEDLLLDVADLNPEKIARIKEVSLAEPTLAGRMISPQGHVTNVNITVQLPDGDTTKEVFEITDYVKALTDRFKQTYPDHDFYHTGMVLMNYAFASEAKADAETLIPLMFVTIIVVMWGLLRSFSSTIATLSIVVLTIMATMGVSGWLEMFLSTATVNVPTLVMTLAVADCIHVVSSMIFALREGKSKRDAIAYSIKVNLMPVFITSATTAIGFLTLNFSAVPVLADLGNLTALGVMIACVLSLTLFPALLLLLPLRETRIRENKSSLMENFGNWVIRNHRKIFPVSIVVMGLLVSFVSLNKLNDIPTGYFSDSTEFRQSTDFQQDNLSGMTTVDFALFTGESSGVNAPEVLKAVDDFANWLRAQPEVDHITTISDTFKRLNKNMHSDEQSYYRLPEEQELAAQYLLLYEMSLPYGLDLNNQLDIDKSATKLTVTMKNLGSKEITSLESRAYAWIADNAPSLKVTAASPNLMFAHIGEANISSLLRGNVLALALISLLLVFALRSLRMGAISLLPNLLPAGIGFGIWGLYSGEINIGLTVALSMTLGIIVDDTVHFLSKYKIAYDQGKSAQESLIFAFSSVGRALWITTLVLTLGFSVLALSSFNMNAHMGMLTAIIIVVALAVDFLFLPAFLMVLDRNNKGALREQTN